VLNRSNWTGPGTDVQTGTVRRSRRHCTARAHSADRALVCSFGLLICVPVDDHEQRRTVWRNDVTDCMETSLFVATNRLRVRGIWIGLIEEAVCDLGKYFFVGFSRFTPASPPPHHCAT